MRAAHLLRRWNEAEMMGASKRMVAWCCGGLISVARSHMITFQSLEDVSTNREWHDQLRAGREEALRTAREQSGSGGRTRCW